MQNSCLKLREGYTLGSAELCLEDYVSFISHPRYRLESTEF